jgi:hypothetical protein
MASRRWVRVDSEIIGQDVLTEPEDLRPGQFLSGGEAWQAYREGRIDATRFGVYGTSNFGPGEIRGNAIRDLAALNKVEIVQGGDRGRLRRPDRPGRRRLRQRRSLGRGQLYRRDELRVPPALIA